MPNSNDEDLVGIKYFDGVFYAITSNKIFESSTGSSWSLSTSTEGGDEFIGLSANSNGVLLALLVDTDLIDVYTPDLPLRIQRKNPNSVWDPAIDTSMHGRPTPRMYFGSYGTNFVVTTSQTDDTYAEGVQAVYVGTPDLMSEKSLPAGFDIGANSKIEGVVEIDGAPFLYGGTRQNGEPALLAIGGDLLELHSGTSYQQSMRKIAQKDSSSYVGIDGNAGFPSFSSDGFHSLDSSLGNLSRELDVKFGVDSFDSTFIVDKRLFVIAHPGFSSVLAFTDNDKDWTIVEDLLPPVETIGKLGPHYYMTQGSASSAGAMYSEDAINWNSAAIEEDANQLQYLDNIYATAENSGRNVAVAVAAGGTIFRTTDGMSWSREYTEASTVGEGFGEVIWDGSRFIALNASQGGRVFTSVDGADWDVVSWEPDFHQPSTDYYFMGLAEHEGGYIATMQYRDDQNLASPLHVISSVDGIRWTKEDEITHSFDGDSYFQDFNYAFQLDRILYAKGYYWAFRRASSTAYRSDTLEKFEPLQLISGSGFSHATDGEDLYVTIGNILVKHR